MSIDLDRKEKRSRRQGVIGQGVNMADGEKLTINVRECATLLGCAPSTIYESIKAHTFTLPYLVVGRRIFISKSALFQAVSQAPNMIAALSRTPAEAQPGDGSA